MSHVYKESPEGAFIGGKYTRTFFLVNYSPIIV